MVGRVGQVFSRASKRGFGQGGIWVALAAMMLAVGAKAEKPEAIAIKRPDQSQAVFLADGRTCQAGLKNVQPREVAVAAYARCMMAHGYNVKLKGISASAVQQGGPGWGNGGYQAPAGSPASTPTPEQLRAVGQHNADVLEQWHAAHANVPPPPSTPRVDPAVLRAQGEKKFVEAFNELNSQPLMFFAETKTKEEKHDAWIRGLQEAANDGYGPAAVWYDYTMPADNNPDERLNFAKMALDDGGQGAGGPDAEFVYGVVELEHPETKQDGMAYMEKGLKDGSLLEAMTLTKLAEQKKDYAQCLTLALAINRAKITMADPQAYRCGKHVSEAERKTALEQAQKVEIRPWAGFTMEALQADQSGAHEMEDLVYADALKVTSAAPTKETFHTLYVYQQRLQQRGNTAVTNMAGPFANVIKTAMPGMGTLLTAMLNAPNVAAEVQANAILTTVSIKEYEGVWIGRFTLRERGDDIEHALRLKAKEVDGHWMLVASDRGGGLDEWTDATLPPVYTPPNYDGPYISEGDLVMRTMFGRAFLR